MAELGRRPRAGADLQHLAAVQHWVRRRFALAEDAPVSVAQLRCMVEGCPPLETALTFWTDDGQRHQVRLLKPIAEVTSIDIAWLIGSAEDHADAGWDCC